ncbi:hypothetical protein [Micromonospora chokoriensis]|uniref:hypothetical protein n=1 Tax=Micromonospora chokoriensis TaxID=356851 RepID=UPI0012F90236|nr:hypothetical protein [Micromonospora chokoriensis]
MAVAIGVSAVMISAWSWLSHDDSLSATDSIWSIIAGAIALTLALLTWLRNKSGPGNIEQNRPAVDCLAESVRTQWREEAEMRGVFRPALLPLRWTAQHGDSRADEIFGTSEEIWRTYAGIDSGRMLVVGRPGAGKTVFTLLLVLEILNRRSPGDPVPVLLPASLWNPQRQHIRTWMAERLEEGYEWTRSPGPVDSTMTIAQWLVQTGQVIPVLDGLDEMSQELLPRAIESLNRVLIPAAQFGPDPVILTCRESEFLAAAPAEYSSGVESAVLWEATTVKVKPYTAEDIGACLVAGVPASQVARWAHLATAVREAPEGPLATALVTPFMISLTRSVLGGEGRDPAELVGRAWPNGRDVELSLLHDLVPSLYDHPLPGPATVALSSEKAQRYLVSLARTLSATGTHEMAWWKLGDSLPIRVHWLLFGLANGIAAAVMFRLLTGPLQALIVGGAVALAAQAVGPVAGVGTPLLLNIRLSTGIARLTTGFLLSLLVGLAVAFTLGLQGAVALSAGAAVGVFGGVAAGLEFVLEQPPAESSQAATPRSVLRADRQALLLRTFVVAPIGGCAVGLAVGLYADLGLPPGERTGVVIGLALALGASVVVGLRHGLLPGLLTGIGLGTFSGTLTAVLLTSAGPLEGPYPVVIGIGLWAQIALALWFTSSYGRYTLGRTASALRGNLPFRLFGFLEDARDRGVLRQAGPRFEFRHAMLQDFLASDGHAVIAAPQSRRTAGKQ